MNRVETELVLKLSRYDLACIQLAYPYDLTKTESRGPFMDALVTVGVDQGTAGQIIQKFT